MTQFGVARAVPALRARLERRRTAEQEAFYRRVPGEDAMHQWQLDRFNELWDVWRQHVPRFRSLALDLGLPGRFASLDEIRDAVPPMDRTTLQAGGDAVLNPAVRPSGVRTTGGSTAEPIRVEVAMSEARVAAADIWYARSWFRVSPADRLFLFWGHSHALGEGLRARAAGAWRRAKDAALGYERHSCYDLSDDGLRMAAERLLAFRPEWVLGYAVALDRFASVNADLVDAFRRLRLKAVVCTAEAFPSAESRKRLGQLLGCPAVMEYGSTETGPIAHEHAHDRYRVFWRHHLLEAVESTEVPGARELLVTNLFHRRTPLVRYRVGDFVVPSEGAPDVRRQFRKILGRRHDVVVLSDGTPIHAMAFAHVLREMAGVSRFQVVQRAHGRIVLHYAAPNSLEGEALARLRRGLARVHPLLGEMDVARVKSLPLTVAGKSRLIRLE